ncbi:amidase [Paramyrothecium foliicola]|nr:amidase [Paramyrothecium foliicola]
MLAPRSDEPALRAIDRVGYSVALDRDAGTWVWRNGGKCTAVLVDIETSNGLLVWLFNNEVVLSTGNFDGDAVLWSWHNIIAGVAVPRRLYSPDPSPALPLSGLRAVIKNNIHLKGVPTSAGSKAFRELCGQRLETASLVQQVLDAGAVIVVGKTKTAQFASEANARDWIDYQPCFNTRTDKYQDPGCSSACSASAVAAYEWRDISIATETFGSIINPAAINGVIGLRPTFGTIQTDGVMPMSKNFDAVGVISRDMGITMVAVKVIAGYTRSDTCPAIAELIIPSNMFPIDDAVQAIYHRFIEQYRNFLGH